MLREVKDEEINRLYDQLCKDFPKEERQDIKRESLNMEYHKGIWKLFFFVEDGEEKGYTFLKEREGNILIQIFAIYPKERGKGIGTRMAKELIQQVRDSKAIFLEVENPRHSKELEKNIRKRIIAFYERLGFEVVDKIRYELYEVEYLIMQYAEKPISPEKIIEVFKLFYPNAPKGSLEIEKVDDLQK